VADIRRNHWPAWAGLRIPWTDTQKIGHVRRIGRFDALALQGRQRFLVFAGNY